MNFYKRFIGDIQKKTGDLSCVEMGVYDRLLDHYYANEQPLPGDADRCCRIARAMTKDERRAVDSVLGQFFVLDAGVYRQKRADEEIAEAQPKIAAAQANGKLGGRPKRHKEQTQEKPGGFPPGTQQEPNAKARQSQSQKEKKEKDPPALRDPPAAAGPRPAKKCPDSFAVNDELRQWAKAEAPGIDIDAETATLRDHTFATARSDWPGTWRNWMRKAAKDAAKNQHRPGANGTSYAQRMDARAICAATLIGANPLRKHPDPETVDVPSRIAP